MKRMNAGLIAAAAIRALLASAVINMLIWRDMRPGAFLIWFVLLWITFVLIHGTRDRGGP